MADMFISGSSFKCFLIVDQASIQIAYHLVESPEVLLSSQFLILKKDYSLLVILSKAYVRST